MDAPPSPTAGQPVIYVVDDAPYLTELYASLLQAEGYVVRTFNDRSQALEALKTDPVRPALLISDYRGISMSAADFIHACRVIHPALRIMMASGLDRHVMHFSGAKPDCFIVKPFAPEEFQQAVAAALRADCFSR